MTRKRISRMVHFKCFYAVKSYLYVKVTDVEGTWKSLVSYISYGNNITFMKSEPLYFVSLYH